MVDLREMNGVVVDQLLRAGGRRCLLADWTWPQAHGLAVPADWSAYRHRGRRSAAAWAG